MALPTMRSAEEEARRMAQVPGIYFATEAGEREAKVAGTGLGVWEVLWLYHSYGGDKSRLLAAYPHLSAEGLQAALRYTELFPEEIEAAIAEAEAMTEEVARHRYSELFEPRT